MFYRRHFHRQKRGLRVGKTKRGIGSPRMVAADAFGLPVAAHQTSAAPLCPSPLSETLLRRVSLVSSRED
jgi:hypothetical protein